MDYSIALCIPTCERSELVRDFLENCGADYARAGIDVYFFDSSGNDETELTVASWPVRDNLFYVRLPQDATLNEKIYRIFRRVDLKKQYDFLSVSNDTTQHAMEALRLLRAHLSGHFDFIDMGYQPALKTRAYVSPNEYLLDCVESAQHIGATFINVKTMLEDVDWSRYKSIFENYGEPDWANMGADMIFYFRRFLELARFRALHIQIDRWMRRTSALRKSAFYEKDMIRYVCEGWVHTFAQLPDAYADKWEACRKSASNYIMTGVSDFLLYRRRGIYSLSTFIRYFRIWRKVTYVPRFLLLFAALVPRAWLDKFYAARERCGLRRLKAFCRMFPRIIIYGAGNHGRAYHDYMLLHGLNYEAFCESRKKRGRDFFAGCPVYGLADLENDLSNIGFIVALQDLNAKDVVPMLRRKTSESHIFYEPLFESEMRYQMGYQSFGTT